MSNNFDNTNDDEAIWNGLFDMADQYDDTAEADLYYEENIYKEDFYKENLSQESFNEEGYFEGIGVYL